MKTTNRVMAASSWILRHTWVLLLVLASLWAGRFLVEHEGPGAATTTQAPADAAATVWTCSMHPQVRLPESGQCPICGMDLIELEPASDGGSRRRLTLSPAARALANVRTQPVLRRAAQAEVRMVGKLDYDETRLATITAWVGGRIERLFVDYTGVQVQKGDHLVELYSPDLYAAEEELLQALQAVRDLEARGLGDNARVARATLEAVRQKLSLLGLRAEQIEEMERGGRASYLTTIYAPSGGIVIHRDAQQGMYVQTGSAIYTIADLSRLWVRLEAYESDLPWLRYGQEVEFTTRALPGETFRGTIAFIDPVLDPRTRTVKVRVNVDNQAGRLKPEMFVRARVRTEVAAGGRVMDRSLAGKWICPMHPEVVKDAAEDCDLCGMDLVTPESLGYADADTGTAPLPLLIPVSAALVTGRRAVVYVEVPGEDGLSFEGREVVLGPRAGDHYLVERGLAEGERVVVQGNFKIDSALQIQARPSMMLPHGGEDPRSHAEQVSGEAARALSEVEAAFERLRQDLESGDIAALRSDFARLGEQVDALDPSGLGADAAVVWQELAMLLGNDAAQGSGVYDIEEARKLFALAETRMLRLRAALGDHGHASQEAETAPPALAAGLREVWKAYLVVHSTLSNDETSSAGESALLEAVQALPRLLPDAEASQALDVRRVALKAATDNLIDSADLEAKRAVFEPISGILTEFLERWRVPELTVYELRCPMAFDGRGALWLQAEREVRNPYFGSEMLSCGSVLRELPVAEQDSPMEEPHDH